MIDYYITPEEYKKAEKKGISAKTLDDRIRVLMWDKEKALNTKPQSKHKAKYRRMAIENGINVGTFYKRVNNLGMSLKDAATKPPINTKSKEYLGTLKEKRLKKIRKHPEHIYKNMRKNNIEYQTFYNRVRGGWSAEDASTHPTMKRGQHRKKHTWNKIATAESERKKRYEL